MANPTTLTARRTLGHPLEQQVVLLFEWQGGPYIDVRREGQGPTEVINVWDYAKGESSIPFTRQSFTATVSGWIKDYGPANLRNDVLTHW